MFSWGQKKGALDEFIEWSSKENNSWSQKLGLKRYLFYNYLESITRVEKIAGEKIKFYEVDLIDKASLEEVFKEVGSICYFSASQQIL